MDPIALVVLVACLIVAVGAGFEVGSIRERRRLADHTPVPMLPDTIATELNELRHLKAQLENPPVQHEHIWPREPDVRKMGWLRYTCAYAGCTMFRWVRAAAR